VLILLSPAQTWTLLLRGRADCVRANLHPIPLLWPSQTVRDIVLVSTLAAGSLALETEVYLGAGIAACLLTCALDAVLAIASFRLWRSGTDDNARFLERIAMLYAVGLVCVIALDRVAGGRG
jgi:hypothetical protein